MSRIKFLASQIETKNNNEQSFHFLFIYFHSYFVSFVPDEWPFDDEKVVQILVLFRIRLFPALCAPTCLCYSLYFYLRCDLSLLMFLFYVSLLIFLLCLCLRFYSISTYISIMSLLCYLQSICLRFYSNSAYVSYLINSYDICSLSRHMVLHHIIFFHLCFPTVCLFMVRSSHPLLVNSFCTYTFNSQKLKI